MQAENKLNEDILKITMTIQMDYPELSKYLNEMAETLPDVSTPEMTNKALSGYYNSLDTILKEYMSNHRKAKAIKQVE